MKTRLTSISKTVNFLAYTDISYKRNVRKVKTVVTSKGSESRVQQDFKPLILVK